MSYIFTNPNPTGKIVGDCVVRAITLVTNSSWEEVYMNLCIKGLDVCDMPNSNSVWINFLKELGYKQYFLPDTCPECYTVEDFSNDYPKGVYLLASGSHLVAIVDGNVCDAWDSRREIPIMYFHKEVKVDE